MNGRKAPLLITSILLNLVLITGALFSESAVTIALLFTLDALIGIIRILYERSAAGRPVGDASPAMTHLRFLEGLYETVADKRGSFQLSNWIPPAYPRNLPYVIDQWSVFFWLVPLAALTWGVLEPFEGHVGVTLIPALVLIGRKHYLILRTWSAAGIYASASARTIRGSRELLYTAALACFAVWGLAAAPPDPARVTATTVLVCLPKFLFECRECGIGPWPLTFTPTTDNIERELSVPERSPQQIFDNERRVVRAWGIHDGLSYALLLAIYLSGILGMVGAVVYESAGVAVLGVGIALFVSPLIAIPTVFVVVWLGYANEEYRLHEDELVAYDSFLEEPQWVVPLEDISSVSVGDNPLGWDILGRFNPLPFTKYPVKVKRQTGEDLQFKALADPDGLARAIRKRGSV